jgi:DNA invertase Pin-like site-specific DNA recombinase
MRLLGYTRVSTASQDAQLQLDALVDSGVQKRDVFADVTSGSRTAIERPGMKRLLDYAESGDTVVVWRIDRLGRSLIDVLNTVNLMRDKGVKIKSLSDGIDPETTSGRLMLATLAEYERELITELIYTQRASVSDVGLRLAA